MSENLVCEYNCRISNIGAFKQLSGLECANTLAPGGFKGILLESNSTNKYVLAESL